MGLLTNFLIATGEGSGAFGRDFMASYYRNKNAKNGSSSMDGVFVAKVPYDTRYLEEEKRKLEEEAGELESEERHVVNEAQKHDFEGRVEDYKARRKNNDALRMENYLLLPKSRKLEDNNTQAVRFISIDESSYKTQQLSDISRAYPHLTISYAVIDAANRFYRNFTLYNGKIYKPYSYETHPLTRKPQSRILRSMRLEFTEIVDMCPMDSTKHLAGEQGTYVSNRTDNYPYRYQNSTVRSFVHHSSADE